MDAAVKFEFNSGFEEVTGAHRGSAGGDYDIGGVESFAEGFYVGFEAIM